MRISSKQKHLLQQFFSERPIKKAYLFGSFARNQGDSKSDIDILVELDHQEPIGLNFFAYQIELEELLNTKVDLVSSEGISQHVRPFIDKDKQLIYERRV